MVNRVLEGAGHTESNFWILFSEEGEPGYYELSYHKSKYPDVVAVIAAFLRGEYGGGNTINLKPHYHRTIENWKETFHNESHSWLIPK